MGHVGLGLGIVQMEKSTPNPHSKLPRGQEAKESTCTALLLLSGISDSHYHTATPEQALPVPEEEAENTWK